MAISREEVEKVSLLARLQLSEDELDTMTAQLGDILDYVELLGELDTDDVEPMAHALDVADVFREDRARPSLDRDRRWPTRRTTTASAIGCRPCWAKRRPWDKVTGPICAQRPASRSANLPVR